MFNFGIYLDWKAVASCIEIRSTHPTVWIHGMERLHSSPGAHMGTDPFVWIVTAQIDV